MNRICSHQDQSSLVLKRFCAINHFEEIWIWAVRLWGGRLRSLPASSLIHEPRWTRMAVNACVEWVKHEVIVPNLRVAEYVSPRQTHSNWRRHVLSGRLKSHAAQVASVTTDGGCERKTETKRRHQLIKNWTLATKGQTVDLELSACNDSSGVHVMDNLVCVTRTAKLRTILSIPG